LARIGTGRFSVPISVTLKAFQWLNVGEKFYFIGGFDKVLAEEEI
jgi:hypothetical protein